MTGRATTKDQPSATAEGRRTRRQLLAGGTGALAAVLTAEALARPAPAGAADGNPVILGQSNDETTATTITNNSFAGTGLVVNTTGIGGPTAIEANSSAFGVTGSGVNVGVIGSSETGQGVSGGSNGGG
jgi:hypothetical protein